MRASPSPGRYGHNVYCGCCRCSLAGWAMHTTEILPEDDGHVHRCAASLAPGMLNTRFVDHFFDYVQTVAAAARVGLRQAGEPRLKRETFSLVVDRHRETTAIVGNLHLD